MPWCLLICVLCPLDIFISNCHGHGHTCFRQDEQSRLAHSGQVMWENLSWFLLLSGAAEVERSANWPAVSLKSPQSERRRQSSTCATIWITNACYSSDVLMNSFVGVSMWCESSCNLYSTFLCVPFGKPACKPLYTQEMFISPKWSWISSGRWRGDGWQITT